LTIIRTTDAKIQKSSFTRHLLKFYLMPVMIIAVPVMVAIRALPVAPSMVVKLMPRISLIEITMAGLVVGPHRTCVPVVAVVSCKRPMFSVAVPVPARVKALCETGGRQQEHR
jgi:hypothetical protein